MIVSKTPFRISFFGGGTDYRQWLKENPGAVIATAIDKYCYISLRELPPFFDYRHRIVYSKIEMVNSIDEIEHPAIRAGLKVMNIECGVEIHHDGDLPARTGLGSSSAFSVGLLNVLFAFKGKIISREALAREAIKLEQEVMKEEVGCQDQIITAYGGFNLVEFSPGDILNFTVKPVTLNKSRIDELRSHLLLLFTGFTRTASLIAKDIVTNIKAKQVELKTMYEMVYEAIKILSSGDIIDFGKLLNESWLLKKSLSKMTSNLYIDEIYETAIKNGAVGGKVLGAGGGGFMLLFAPPDAHKKIKEVLKNSLFVPFDFDKTGSTIIVYQP